MPARLQGDDMRGLAASLAPGMVVGQAWATPPLPVGPALATDASKFASRVGAHTRQPSFTWFQNLEFRLLGVC